MLTQKGFSFFETPFREWVEKGNRVRPFKNKFQDAFSRTKIVENGQKSRRPFDFSKKAVPTLKGNVLLQLIKGIRKSN
jgi:hypothetical protein